MSKREQIFECSQCGTQYPKWIGRCHECQKWGTIIESLSTSNRETTSSLPAKPIQTVDFSQIALGNASRLTTMINEFDRVLGGGIVRGSLVLIGGAPGIGKSTLLLQILKNLPAPVLYISGEETGPQIKLRLDRLGIACNHIQFANAASTEKICATIAHLKPTLTIVDSIQTIRSESSSSPPGSLAQVSISCTKLMEAAKVNNTAVFIIGHITKQGVVAGPKTLEHLVDTVLYLEGDKHHFYRLLRSVKNRFGSVDEVGIFEMTDRGLEEVKNPSNVFLQDFDETTTGTVTTVVMEGTRPLLVEIQALTSKTYFGYPKRATSGFKESRLEVLIAILTKRLGLKLGDQDIYVNVAGGLKITEPAADLAVAAAIISSLRDVPLPAKTCVFGELGLGGEVRPVAFAEKRIREAEQLGFQYVICPPIKKDNSFKITLREIKHIKDMQM